MAENGGGGNVAIVGIVVVAAIVLVGAFFYFQGGVNNAVQDKSGTDTSIELQGGDDGGEGTSLQFKQNQE